MNPVAAAKLALALAGIVVFLFGINSGSDLLRWTGTALVVVAWLLRFVDRPASRSRRGPPDQPEDG